MIESRFGKIILKYFEKEYKDTYLYKNHPLSNIKFTEYTASIELTQYYVFSMEDTSKHFRIVCGIPKDGDEIKLSAKAIIGCGSKYVEFAVGLQQLKTKHLLVAIGRALVSLYIHAYEYGVSDRYEPGWGLPDVVFNNSVAKEAFGGIREILYSIPDDFYKEVDYD